MVSESNKIGLLPAILMVAGNMMGSGVFMLPANLAGIGSIAIIGWLITVVGAIALGLVFAKLTEVTTAAGGPYAYARKAFGDYMGYQTNLVYWLANVIGNVGLAVAGLGYLTPFFPALRDPLVMALAQIAVIWFFTYANILGPRVVGRMQGITTTVALFPIVGVALLGWFWFNPETYMEGWNVSGESSLTAVGMTLNFTLWAFIGVESASVSTAVVKNPAKNVPIATVVGVLLAAVCYVLSSSAIMGIIPNKELVSSSAPFSQAVSIALGSTAGKIVALCAPTASEQFGKIASIAVIMTLLPYIYSSVAIKILGREKMSDREGLFYTIVGLIAAVYSLSAMIGSNSEQTRWALIFVISTIIFYELSVNRKIEIRETHVKPGGCCVPRWVRYMTLTITIAALIAMFWVSVSDYSSKRISEYVNTSVTADPAN